MMKNICYNVFTLEKKPSIHKEKGKPMQTTFNQIIEEIEKGKTAIGIEFGTTRIKAVLID